MHVTSRQCYTVGNSVAKTAQKLYNEMPRHKRKTSVSMFMREYAKTDKYGKGIVRQAISTDGKGAYEQGVEDAIRGQFEPSKFGPPS
jgi:hypothetical protein